MCQTKLAYEEPFYYNRENTVSFDEFQQICRYPEKNIEALLRSHIQHLGNVNFIFVGSERHLISEMFLSSAKPFYNSTRQMELYPIAKERKADKITSGAFIKRHAFLSASSVQAAMKKLLELDLITVENASFSIPDHFLWLYLKKLMGEG